MRRVETSNLSLQALMHPMWLPSFDSSGSFYTFYYDESNNVRRLSINKHKNSYNVDNDKNQIAAANFMLAGVAHKDRTSTADVGALLTDLRLPPSAKELKFDQVASGRFDMALKSRRVRPFLTWLLDSDLYLHCFNLNMEYWSFIDTCFRAANSRRGRQTNGPVIHTQLSCRIRRTQNNSHRVFYLIGNPYLNGSNQ